MVSCCLGEQIRGQVCSDNWTRMNYIHCSPRADDKKGGLSMHELSRRDALKALAATTGGIAFVSLAGDIEKAAGADSPIAAGGTRLTGVLVYPGDTDYESARQLWDGLFSSYPSVIVFCSQPKDAANAIAWARQNEVAIRARSGRHCLEGWSGVDGGVTVDVSGLKSISFDRKTATVTVGTGNTQSQVIAGLGPHEAVVPTGSEASVGIGGVTLGGGIGFLSRFLGVTCDSLTALEIAVPHNKNEAQLLRADESHNSDLLWASRGGGGGNFGIATSYTFQTAHIPTASWCEVTWTFADWKRAFAAWQEWSHAVDVRFGSNFAVLGKQADYVALQGVFAGPEDKMRSLLAPLLSIGSPKLTASSGSYVEAFNYFNQGGRTTANWKFSSAWAYKPLPPEAVEVVDAYLSKAPAPLCNFWCLAHGGATNVAPRGGSAWFHRDAHFYAEPGAGWSDPNLTEPCVAWLDEFRAALNPYVEGGYVNVPDASFQDWGTKYYGSNFERLRRVKSVYDPDNVFTFAQSIPPAT